VVAGTFVNYASTITNNNSVLLFEKTVSGAAAEFRFREKVIVGQSAGQVVEVAGMQVTAELLNEPNSYCSGVTVSIAANIVTATFDAPEAGAPAGTYTFSANGSALPAAAVEVETGASVSYDFSAVTGAELTGAYIFTMELIPDVGQPHADETCTASVSINLQPVAINHAPTFHYNNHLNVTNFTGLGTATDPYTFTVTNNTSNGEVSFRITDEDGQATALIECNSKPSWVIIDDTNDRITFSPTSSDTVSFDCHANDGTIYSFTSVYFSVTINDPPTFSYTSQQNLSNWSGAGTEGSPYTFITKIAKHDARMNFNVTDAQGDSTTLECDNLPGFALPDNVNKRIDILANASHISGSAYTFSCRSYDGELYSSQRIYFSATIQDVVYNLHDGTAATLKHDAYGTKGVPHANNLPSGRSRAAICVDGDDNTWMFGGVAIAPNMNIGNMSDLWKFDHVSGHWTWIAGPKDHVENATYGTLGVSAPTNTPGARQLAACAFDSVGDMWLFGGLAGGRKSDLWKYDVSAGEWIWIAGPSGQNVTGVYGTINVADANNRIGSRQEMALHVDANNKIWIYGGFGLGTTTTLGNLNDVWEFDGTDFIWRKGSSSVGGTGTFGTKNVSDAGNSPPAMRQFGYSSVGNRLYVFGGSGLDSNGDLGNLHALWEMITTSGTPIWTWISGTSLRSAAGTYGTMGTPHSANIPGGRKDMMMTRDENNNLWISGGFGRGASGGGGRLNDFWRYDSVTNEWTWIAGQNSINQASIYGTKGVYDGSNKPGSHLYATLMVNDNKPILFGGQQHRQDNILYMENDTTWRWNGTQWAWIKGDNGDPSKANAFGTKGVTDSANVITSAFGSRYLNESGNLVAFGGVGFDDSGILGSYSSLFKYDRTDFTWIAGSNAADAVGNWGALGVTASTNTPSGRFHPGFAQGSAAGSYYVFGGRGYDINRGIGPLNDLWYFNGTDWTWLKGSSAFSAAGTFGTKGTPATGNTPGARHLLDMHKLSTDELILFGGQGNASNTNFGRLNDLWKFNGTNWVWVSGSNVINQTATYGTKGVTDAANIPGARSHYCSIVDSSDNLWIFGGIGNNTTGTQLPLNDLWKFDGTNWTWVAGTTSHNDAGTWGTRGQAHQDNTPPSMSSCSMALDSNNHIWVFGGAASNGAKYNSLWRFDGENWTHIKGTSSLDEPLSHVGVGNAANTPGGMDAAAMWIHSGVLYIALGTAISGAETGASRAIWSMEIP